MAMPTMTTRRLWHVPVCAGIGAVFAAAGLGLAGAAVADPVGDAMTPPGNQAPAAEADPATADNAAAPAAVVPQQVPEIANPVYGSGQYGSGPLGTLRDLWHQAHDPYGLNQSDATPGASAPPAGAGPAPALPPGYVSLNAPGSETVSSAPKSDTASTGGPALPPGYYSLDGPPPPGYEYRQPGEPAGSAAATDPAAQGTEANR